MKGPSRHMPPPYKPEMSVAAGVVVWTSVLCLLALPGLLWWPLAFVFPLLYALMTLFGWIRDKRIARERSSESICDFARSFDCRRTDTWIIRAVYEELSHCYPIRPDDSFEDLRIDPEDLDDLSYLIAERIGRSMDGTETNPMFGKVTTVHDLVAFLQHQPRLSPV